MAQSFVPSSVKVRLELLHETEAMQGGQPSPGNTKPFVLHKMFVRRGFSGTKEIPDHVWEPMKEEAKLRMNELSSRWPPEVRPPFGIQLLYRCPEKEDAEKTHYQQDLGTPMFAYQGVLTFLVNVGDGLAHEVTLRAASIIYHTAPLEQAVTTKAPNKQDQETNVPYLSGWQPEAFLPQRHRTDPTPVTRRTSGPPRSMPLNITLNPQVFEESLLSAQRPDAPPAQIDPRVLASTFLPAKSQPVVPAAARSAPPPGPWDQQSLLPQMATSAPPPGPWDRQSLLPQLTTSAPAAGVAEQILSSKSCVVLPIRGAPDSSQGSRIIWAVEGRKFDTQDQRHTSSTFKVVLGGRRRACQIKLNCTGVDEEHGRQQCNFQKTKGKGSITLKCGDLDSDVDSSQQSARVFFNIGCETTLQQRRGPVHWQFDQIACCCLAKDLKEWDFKSAIDTGKHKKVLIIVEIVPEAGCPRAVPENEEPEFQLPEEKVQAWLNATGDLPDGAATNIGAPPGLPGPGDDDVSDGDGDQDGAPGPPAGGPQEGGAEKRETPGVWSVSRDQSSALPQSFSAPPFSRDDPPWTPMQQGSMLSPPQPPPPPPPAVVPTVQRSAPAALPARVYSAPVRIQKQFSNVMEGTQMKIFWAISLKIFDTHNKSQMSPSSFKLTFPGKVEHSFVIMLKPIEGEWKKKGSDFRKGEGQGHVTVKCETVNDESPQLEARIKLYLGPQGDRQLETDWQDNDFKEFPSFTVKRLVGPGVEKADVFDFLSARDDSKACVPLSLWIEPRESASSSTQAFESS